MNPVFLVLLILLFLYFISILNNNNIEKFVDIAEPGIHDTQTCSSSGDVSQGPNYSGCDSHMCSTELKNSSSRIRKCYKKGDVGQRCETLPNPNLNSCDTGLICGRLNRDVSANSDHGKYCLTKPYSCKNLRTAGCLENETCKKEINHGYKCS